MLRLRLQNTRRRMSSGEAHTWSVHTGCSSAHTRVEAVEQRGQASQPIRQDPQAAAAAKREHSAPEEVDGGGGKLAVDLSLASGVREAAAAAAAGGKGAAALLPLPESSAAVTRCPLQEQKPAGKRATSLLATESAEHAAPRPPARPPAPAPRLACCSLLRCTGPCSTQRRLPNGLLPCSQSSCCC
jgi:hypothetical protein